MEIVQEEEVGQTETGKLSITGDQQLACARVSCHITGSESMSTLWFLRYLAQCGHIHHTMILACLQASQRQHDIIHSQSIHSHDGRGSVERMLLSPSCRGCQQYI